MLQAKKRYAGELWVRDHGVMVLKEKVAVSGLETARRDPPPFVSTVVSYTLAQLLDSSLSRDERLSRVSTRVHELVRALRTGTISFDQIIQSKKLSAPIDTYRRTGRALPVHVAVAARSDARRAAGDADAVVYRPGDRVSFMITEPPLGRAASTNTSELGEEPLHAWRTGMRPHVKYYTDALIAPLCRILEFVVAPNIATSGADENLVKNAVINNLNLNSVVAVDPSEQRAPPSKLLKTASQVVVRRCRVCCVRLSRNATESVCARCQARAAPQIAALEREDSERRAAIGRERAAIFSKCTECKQRVGSRSCNTRTLGDLEDLHTAILCENRSCETFWQRLMNDRRYRRTIV